MRILTTLALIILSAPCAYAHDNESFIDQVGSYNAAIVAQTGGNNNALTLQKGTYNRALVGQIAVPTSSGTNASFVAQNGSQNSAIVAQQTSSGGRNNQATIQVGIGNVAITTQTAVGSLVNNA